LTSRPLSVLMLNLPSPPGMNIDRDFAGGFGVPGPSQRARYGHDRDRISVSPPLYEAYAASILRQLGVDVSILDCQASDLDVPQILDYLDGRHFDVLVARPSLASLDADLSLLRKIHEEIPNSKTVLWGPVCSAWPRRVLSYLPGSIAIDGEIEAALPRLVKHISQNQRYDSLPGLVSISGRTVRRTGRVAVQDLDSLPLPAYDLLPMGLYVDIGKVAPRSEARENFFTVLSSRGCNYGCYYCPYNVMFGKPWRAMSPERAVAEIQYLVDHYGIRRFWFRDQIWNADIDRAAEICRLIIQRDLDIVWRAEIRADHVTESLARLMADSGCVNAQIGVETGDPDILVKAKPGMNIEKLERGWRLLRDAGIPVTANVVVGLPGENKLSIAKTGELLKRFRPARCNVALLVAYPATPLYRLAVSNGWVIDPKAGYVLSGQCELSPDELLQARRYLLDLANPKEKLRRIIRAGRRLDIRAVAAELASRIQQARFARAIRSAKPSV